MWKSLLTLVVLVGAVFAVPAVGGAAGLADAPSGCVASIDGLETTIRWNPAQGAVDYRAFRSVDGSPAYWRGLSSTTSFTDTLRNAGVHEYSVQARGDDGIWSDSAVCTPTLDPAVGNGDVPPPASCAASNVGTTAALQWAPVDGAVTYRAFRSVNGSPAWWRGLSASTEFFDELRRSGLHQYSVQARGVNGVWSESVNCGAPLSAANGAGPVDAPASCSALNNGQLASILWDAVPGAQDYRLYRSVNGSQEWWRGRISITEFDDTLRSSGLHQYSVQARGLDGVWSESTACGEALDPQA